MSRAQKQIRDYSRMRLILVGGLFFLLWSCLWVRAGYLQIVQGPTLAEQALRQHLASEYDRGKRGGVVDRNGQSLAMSVEFTAVSAQPKDIRNINDTADQLSKILGQPRRAIMSKLQSHANFVYLARKVNDRAAAQIKAAALPGVSLSTEYGRSYPNKHMAGQLLGFVGYDDQGLEGLEKSYESVLAGKRAKYVVQRDASGRRLYLDAQGREMSNADGGDVKLTIDSQIQFFAEEALAKAVTENHAKAGVCIVVHVKSAEILAWANYPFFNPNGGDNSDAKAARNRLALDVLEPGSTMKPILVAAALQEKVVRPDTLYNCENGRWNFQHIAVINDTHPYDMLPVNKILRWSSNIGAAKIGLDLGARKLSGYFQKVGFGERTGLPLPGEAKGLLRPVSAWSKLDLATNSFGQGIGVTPLQLAQAFHIIANNGVKKPLRLVIDPPQESASSPEERVFDAQVAKSVQLMMREVVEEEKGTGVKAHIDGLELGGKTGTAQKAKATGGYGNKYLANFVGFIPAVDPEYLVLVMVDEPEPSHYGGVVAAPAVREVTLKSLSYLGRLPETVKLAEERGPSAPQVAASEVSEGMGVAFPPMNIAENSAEVPNLVGLPLRKAVEILAGKGVVPALKGNGLVVGKQAPQAGSNWNDADKAAFTLWLSKAS